MVVLAATAAPAPAQAQASTQAPASFKLVKTDVVGPKRYTAGDVLKVSGLSVGQPVVIADLDAAARRLASTGFFRKVNYSYVTNDGGLILTLEVEEEDWTTPVVFDNFVWFADDDLFQLLRRSLPLFNGMVPGNAGSSGFISRELQAILTERKLPGRVEFTPGVNRQFVFSVTGAGAALRVCAVRFDGAHDVPDSLLQDAARELISADYSRSFTTAFSNGTLQQVYRRRGYWKAEIAPPQATPDTGTGCGGITVTLAISEGPAYAWDHAAWTGNAAIPAKDLDTALGMKNGQIADNSKIDEGLRAVRTVYSKLGYLQQAVKPTPRLDDAARKVVFEMAVTEGPQFAMGTLEIVGLPASDETSLRKKWRLAAGAVYDASYLAGFLEQVARPVATARRATVSSELKLDPAARTVTVRLIFK